MELVALPQICRNFPISPLVRIERESHLDAIESALRNKNQLLFVSGEEGIGKTTLLAQMMERSPDSVIGLFINPIGSISYSVNLH